MTDFDDRPRPHDIGAEQATLGAMLWSPEAAAKVAEILARDDFYRPSHQTIYERITAMRRDGIPVDSETVRAELEKHHEFSGDFKPPYLHDLMTACPTVTNADYYARTVARLASRRRVLETLERAQQQAWTGTDLAELTERAAYDLTVETRLADVEHAVTAVELDELLAAEDDTAYDWVIPGFLERGDRFVLTGAEGSGKSTLLRQVGMQASSGIHPFTGAHIAPLRVLQVDLENSEAQSRRELRPLRLAAGDRYRAGHFFLRSRPEGMDLTGQADREWLRRLAETVAPDLLIIGPLYKMANGSPIEEESAKPVAVTLDALRVQIGCALLIEAHASKTMHGTRRAIEPYGWSGWLRWPEFGFHIGKDGQLTPWRGQRDASRDIPAALQRGGTWPWSPLTRPRDILWARIVGYCEQIGDRPSYRDLAEMTGASVGAVQKAIAEHRAEWDTLGGAE
ncbi:DnaB-like helicase N-terminal domain-containing protein [Actinomadura rugatobispora]|uniref:DnaB-like helicase N-terminal domain-containing protein n=1 Tax=Actinomadura rugatobispora TaxID=1994 RepID=A0ABW1A355_9ACTN|nr:hypothetical protein GCM10010200_029110 [Actinomadura rugatobispora]